MGRVLIGCEASGVVREAFRRRGHEAWSCDIREAEDGSQWHLHGDVRDWLGGLDGRKWDLMIAHPPCTDLAVSGARWFREKGEERIQEGLRLVRELMFCRDIRRICVENPVSLIGSRIRPCDQVIQPWMFGEMECKKTCLWLKNLNKLRGTKKVAAIGESVWQMSPSEDRGLLRSRTFVGVAEAMADQWGDLL